MKKGLKIGLVLSSVVLAVAITTAIVLTKRKKDKEDEQKSKDQKAKEDALEESQSTQTSGASVDDGVSDNRGYIIPKRNRNGEVINPLIEVKGIMLYPAQSSSDPSKGYKGADGSATLRTEASVNNGTWNNIIGGHEKYKAGTPIGTVISETRDKMTPSMRWFKVKMKKPCCGIFSDYTEGWVRADVVTFNKYKSNNSAEGNMDGMIQRYNTSYQLGAQVFPHSTWANPIYDVFSGMDGNEFEMDGILNDL